MTFRAFIKQYRRELDQIVAQRLGHVEVTILNDEERKQWILNDEGLYNWARSEGVRI